MVSKSAKGLRLKISAREGDILHDGDVDWRRGAGPVDFGVGHGEDGCSGTCEGGDFARQKVRGPDLQQTPALRV
jgi:hypothetical protein